jgi:hypothetical protein
LYAGEKNLEDAEGSHLKTKKEATRGLIFRTHATKTCKLEADFFDKTGSTA